MKPLKLPFYDETTQHYFSDVTDQSVASNDGNEESRKRTTSTASTVPASSSYDFSIKQYVKVAELPSENHCEELKKTCENLDPTTTSYDSEYLTDANLANNGNVVYTDVQQSISNVAKVSGKEDDRPLEDGLSNTMNSKFCSENDLPYTRHCSEKSMPKLKVSAKCNRASFKRQSSSSSGIIEDLIEDSLKEETNFLLGYVPSVILPESDIDADSVETGKNCRKYEIDDIENVNSGDDASQEAYVDLERATLLSHDT